jgi:uncharacterized protein YegL
MRTKPGKKDSPRSFIGFIFVLSMLIVAGCSGSGTETSEGGHLPPTPPEPMVQVTIRDVDTLVFEDGCFENRVFFNIVDPDGVVDAVDRDAIKLFVDGSPESTFNYQPSINFGNDKSISIVFAMDYSGSMTTEAISAMEEAVLSFINNNLRAGDWAQIIKFAGDLEPSIWVELPDDINYLENFIYGEGPQISTQTDIYGAADLAVTQLSQMTDTTDRLAVILLTDGAQNPPHSSPVALDAMIRDAQEARVPFFNIGFMFNYWFNEEDIKRIARETGGLYFKIFDADSLFRKYGALGKILISEYHLLSYEICGTPTQSKNIELQVTIDSLTGSARYYYR